MPISPDETMALASVGGSGATVLINRSSDTVKRKLADWTAGAIVGFFGGPAVADMLGVTNDHMRAGVALILSAVGRIVLTKVVEFANNLTFKDIVSRLTLKQ